MSMTHTLHHGDCLEVMATLDADSVDALVTDPPYGLEFMGKDWDHGLPGEAYWAEALRVAKPGAHTLAFGGTRTHHRLMCAIEDAGWEIRDVLMWVYGSGFPKSLDVGRALDKVAGVDTASDERWVPTPHPITGAYKTASGNSQQVGQAKPGLRCLYTPATPLRCQWHGWGTALKPAWESIVLATKPLTAEGELATIVENLVTLESQLCLLLSDASLTGVDSSSNLSVQKLLDIARWTAADRISTRDGLCGAMDMSRFESAIVSSLNTVSSWRCTFTKHCEPKSMSTTATAIGQTIDWKTLRCFLSGLTLHYIIRAAIDQHGSWWHVLPAARALNAAAVNIDSTRELSVLASAMSSGLVTCPAETGLGLRPNAEPIILCRKPLIGTVAENVTEWGVGGLNIEACRVGTDDDRSRPPGRSPANTWDLSNRDKPSESHASGRWPANFIHDGSDEVVGLMPSNVNGQVGMTKTEGGHRFIVGDTKTVQKFDHGKTDSGSAARFFYCAKASKADRNSGMLNGKVNTNPCVKPLSLMRYLCRLITPPSGVILDPFMGSGSTGKAAILEGFNFIGIEQEAEYIEIAEARIEYATQEVGLFAGVEI